MATDLDAVVLKWPPSTDVTAAVSGPSASIARLTAGAMDGPNVPQAAERTALVAQLTVLRNSWRDDVPNLAHIAGNWSALEALVADQAADGSAADVAVTAVAARAAFAALAHPAVVNATVSTVIAAVGNLSVCRRRRGAAVRLPSLSLCLSLSFVASLCSATRLLCRRRCSTCETPCSGCRGT